jgi:hypothetical protein
MGNGLPAQIKPIPEDCIEYLQSDLCYINYQRLLQQSDKIRNNYKTFGTIRNLRVILVKFIDFVGASRMRNQYAQSIKMSVLPLAF